MCPDEELQIASVLYLGDVGGIACGLKWPGAGENACVTSLTHLRVDDSHPLAARIGAYQSKRSAKIALSADGPRQPRRSAELRRKKRRTSGNGVRDSTHASLPRILSGREYCCLRTAGRSSAASQRGRGDRQRPAATDVAASPAIASGFRRDSIDGSSTQNQPGCREAYRRSQSGAG